MPILNTLNGVSRVVSSTASAVGSLTSAGQTTGGSWREQLRPASWRGVPFGVLGADFNFGRKNAIHEYPFRDHPWVEDMGRATRRIHITGFLVGDNANTQRDQLVGACEAGGQGILVHPTLGRLTVSLISASSAERWDKGRVFEISLSFIEGGARRFPTNLTSTTDAVTAAASAADAASSQDFMSRMASSLTYGVASVDAVVSTTGNWARQAQRIADDASNIYSSVSSLPGTFGRYFGGRRKGFSNFTNAIQQTSFSSQQLLSIGNVTRSNVSTAASTLASVASAL